jgi:hypothetical protein
MRSTRFRGRKRQVMLLSLVSAVVAIGLAVAGCSSSSGPSTQNSSGGSSTQNSASSANQAQAALTTAEALISKYSNASAVKVPMPTVPFKPGSKKVLVIAADLTDPYVVSEVKYTDDALSAIGWKASPTFDSNSSVQAADGFMQQAVEQGYNAVDAPSLVAGAATGSEVNAVMKAGASVACFLCLTQREIKSSNIISAADSDVLDGQLIAAEAIVLSHGKGTFLVFNTPEYADLVARIDAFKAYVTSNCPECKAIPETIPAADFAEPGPPEWTAALSKYPAGTVSAVVTGAPFLSLAFANTEQKEGRSDIKVLDTGELTTQAAQVIGSGTSPYVASITSPVEFAQWALVDALARKVVGASGAVDLNSLPSLLVTKDNASVVSSGSSQPDVNYKEQFEKLWGH